MNNYLLKHFCVFNFRCRLGLRKYFSTKSFLLYSNYLPYFVPHTVFHINVEERVSPSTVCLLYTWVGGTNTTASGQGLCLLYIQGTKSEPLSTLCVSYVVKDGNNDPTLFAPCKPVWHLSVTACDQCSAQEQQNS